jgi:hypothetical protein
MADQELDLFIEDIDSVLYRYGLILYDNQPLVYSSEKARVWQQFKYYGFRLLIHFTTIHYLHLNLIADNG